MVQVEDIVPSLNRFIVGVGKAGEVNCYAATSCQCAWQWEPP